MQVPLLAQGVEAQARMSGGRGENTRAWHPDPQEAEEGAEAGVRAPQVEAGREPPKMSCLDISARDHCQQ